MSCENQNKKLGGVKAVYCQKPGETDEDFYKRAMEGKEPILKAPDPEEAIKPKMRPGGIEINPINPIIRSVEQIIPLKKPEDEKN